MKKIEKMVCILLISLVCALALTACGGQEKNISANDSRSEMAVEPQATADKAEKSKEESQATADKAEESKEESQTTAGNTKESGGITEMTENDSVNSTTDKESITIEADGNKVLVAYFSATGTTKKLAEYAAEVMDADLYEIVPAEPYTDADLNYNDRNSRTSIEMNDKSIKPAINGSVPNMEQYTTVFIAYPIWWGDAPHIMDTFMESYDFSGKTIVPFCTSGSSGIGSSAKNLHDYTDSSATWLDGARLKSSLSKEDMADWIRELSLGIEVK